MKMLDPRSLRNTGRLARSPKPSASATMGLLAAALLAGNSGCKPASSTASASGDAARRPLRVQGVHPERGAIARHLVLPGSVRPWQQVVLQAKVSGYLKRITVDRGDWVKAGQLLAELEAPELQADLGRYEAEEKAATVEARRLRQAAAQAPDLVVAQTLDEAEARLAVAQARVQRVRMLLDYTRLTAPFAGVITRRWVDPGAFIPVATSGDPDAGAVVSLMDFERVRVECAIPETEVLRVHTGVSATVRLGADASRVFHGKVSRVAYALDPHSKTMFAELDLENKAHRLRPGMYVEVDLEVERKTGVLLLPGKALHSVKGQSFVFVARQGLAVQVPVRLGLDDGRRVEIVEGLTPQDVVIVGAPGTLMAGQPVELIQAP